jgi:hypothetical protein
MSQRHLGKRRFARAFGPRCELARLARGNVGLATDARNLRACFSRCLLLRRLGRGRARVGRGDRRLGRARATP